MHDGGGRGGGHVSSWGGIKQRTMHKNFGWFVKAHSRRVAASMIEFVEAKSR